MPLVRTPLPPEKASLGPSLRASTLPPLSVTRVLTAVADAVAIQCGGLWSKRGIVWAVTPTKLVLYPLFMNRTPPALEFPLPPSLRSMDHDEMPHINVSITEVSAGSRSAGCFAILLVSDVGLCRLWSNVSWPITSTAHATPVIPESVLDGYRDISIEAEVEHAVVRSRSLPAFLPRSLWAAAVCSNDK